MPTPKETATKKAAVITVEEWEVEKYLTQVASNKDIEEVRIERDILIEKYNRLKRKYKLQSIETSHQRSHLKRIRAERDNLELSVQQLEQKLKLEKKQFKQQINETSNRFKKREECNNQISDILTITVKQYKNLVNTTEIALLKSNEDKQQLEAKLRKVEQDNLMLKQELEKLKATHASSVANPIGADTDFDMDKEAAAAEERSAFSLLDNSLMRENLLPPAFRGYTVFGSISPKPSFCKNPTPDNFLEKENPETLFENKKK